MRGRVPNKQQAEGGVVEEEEDIFKNAKGKRSDQMFVSIADALEKALEDAKEFNSINRKKINRVRMSGFYIRIALPFIINTVVSLLQYFYQPCQDRVMPLYVAGFSIFLGTVCLISEYFRRGAADREKDKEIKQLLRVAHNLPKSKSGKSLWEVLADDRMFHSFGTRFVATYRDGEWYPVPDNLLINGDIILLFDGDTAPALLSQLLEIPQNENNSKTSTSQPTITPITINENDLRIQQGEIIKKGNYLHIQSVLKQLKLDNMKSIDLSGFAGLFRVKSTPIYDYTFAFLVTVPETTILNSHIVNGFSHVIRYISITYVVLALMTSIARYFVRPDGNSNIFLFILRPALPYLALSGMTAPIIQTLMERLSARLLIQHIQKENKNTSNLDQPDSDPFQNSSKDRTMKSNLLDKDPMWKVGENTHPVSLRENVILDLEQLVHNLGAITNLCVLNEHVILAERASCDEICTFNKDKSISVKELESNPSFVSGLRFKDSSLEKNAYPLKSIGICCGLETLQNDIFVFPNIGKSISSEGITNQDASVKENKNLVVSPESRSQGNLSSSALYEKLMNGKEQGDVLNFIGFERIPPVHMKVLAAKIGINPRDIHKSFLIKKRFIFYDRSSLPPVSMDSVFPSTSIYHSWSALRGCPKFTLIVVESLGVESDKQSKISEQEVYDASNITSSFNQLLSSIDSGSSSESAAAKITEDPTLKPKYHTFLFGDSRLFVPHASYIAIEGDEVVTISNDEMQAIQAKEKEWQESQSDYVSLSYSAISQKDAEELINYQNQSDNPVTVRLPCPDTFQPSHLSTVSSFKSTSTNESAVLNKFHTAEEEGSSRSLSSNGIPTSSTSAPQNVLDIVSNLAKSQVFLGMASASGKPRAHFPQFVRELNQSGIRFVDFSPRNVLFTKDLLENLEIDTNRCIPLSLTKGDKVQESLDVPDGIEEIKYSLKEGNDLALRVNAFANSSMLSIKEMIKVMKANGEVVGVMGGGDKSTNLNLFLESNLSIGIVSDIQSTSQRAMDKRYAELGRRLNLSSVPEADEAKASQSLIEQLQTVEYAAGLSFAITTLPCALVIHGEARYSHVTKILLEGRRLLFNVRQAMVLYFAMSLTTATLILLSYCFSIDMIYSTQGILWLQWIHFPLLSIPNIYNAASSGTSSYVPSKKKGEFWDHIDSTKRLLTIVFYSFIRVFPTAAFIVALYCGIYVNAGSTPPNNYPFINESLVLWGPFNLPNVNPNITCSIVNPRAKVSPLCISSATIGFVQFAYIWALIWTAATFARRTDTMWGQRRRNKIWWVCALCSLSIQFGASCIPVTGPYGCNSSLLWLTLPNPYAWIAVILWPVVIIAIAEACKYHDGKVLKEMRENDRIDFDKPLSIKQKVYAVEVKS